MWVNSVLFSPRFGVTGTLRVLVSRLFSIERIKAFTLASAILLVMAIQGCATSGHPADRYKPVPASKSERVHRVQPGDTLYSIAWRYNTDYKALAKINRIRKPYTIYAGQLIRLKPGTGVNTQPVPGKKPAASTSKTSTSKNNSAAKNNKVARQSSTAKPAKRDKAGRPTQAQSDTAKTATSAAEQKVAGDWRWPLDNQIKITQSFGQTSLVKGVTLDTQKRRDVKAAAAGEVVYAGSGVRGYGKFLILKHSEILLSAYAFNSKLLVSEGETVKKGDLIAKSGQNNEGEPRLYFEIRRDGKPVDPLRYLPRP